MRVLKPILYPGHPHTCTYRRGCDGRAELWYEVPFTNRYGNLKTRCSTVCRECADRIANKYPVERYG